MRPRVSADDAALYRRCVRLESAARAQEHERLERREVRAEAAQYSAKKAKARARAGARCARDAARVALELEQLAVATYGDGARAFTKQFEGRLAVPVRHAAYSLAKRRSLDLAPSETAGAIAVSTHSHTRKPSRFFSLQVVGASSLRATDLTRD